MALQPWRIGKVTRMADETDDTKRFWIEVPELTSFNFIPGQFVTLDIPIHEKPNNAGAVIPLPHGPMAPMFLNW
ncbi:MAG: hypothetical protein ABI707_19235 [Ferruginibacter sp.]